MKYICDQIEYLFHSTFCTNMYSLHAQDDYFIVTDIKNMQRRSYKDMDDLGTGISIRDGYVNDAYEDIEGKIP